MISSSSSAACPPALVQDVAFVGQLLASLSVPVFVLDTNARVTIWNRACEELTGVPAHEVLGTGDHWRSFYNLQRPTLADIVLRARRDPAPSPQAHDAASNEDRSPPGLSIESWCDMPRAGRRRYLAADASPIFNAQGQLSAVVETLRDLTDEKMAQAALEQLATRDGLTGLANRRCFDDTLQAEWARATRLRHSSPPR
jgi:PAS domain-containing protein